MALLTQHAVSSPVLRSQPLLAETVAGRLAIRQPGRIRLIALEDVVFLEARGNRIVLHTADDSVSVRHSLESIGSRLDDRFVRVHRSTIVRLDCVREVRLLGHGACALLLDGDRKVRVGRRFLAAVRQRVPTGQA